MSADGAGDPFGALLADPASPIVGRSGGPLSGTTFVAKDLFDVAGIVTGAGQPRWAATHPPAEAHATAVQRLLDAGAVLVGKSHTSEMAFSLSADNAHYGMPVNPAAPDREPGGSSSGSAAAVAGGWCDLGLATDTLGSVRVPASYCGIYGWRPTHGLVPDDGVHPLAPSFDTVGLLVRDPALLARAAEVLVGTALPSGGAARLLLAADGFDLVDVDLWDEAEALGPVGSADLAPLGLGFDGLMLAFRDLQGPEVVEAHGAWIDAEGPAFGPGVAERVAYALTVTPEQRAAAQAVRDEVRAHLDAVLGPGDVLVLPAAGPPSRRDATAEDRAAARNVAAALSVVGSMAGAPAVTIPARRTDQGPIGLCLMGSPGSDGLLLSLIAPRPPVPPATRPGSA